MLKFWRSAAAALFTAVLVAGCGTQATSPDASPVPGVPTSTAGAAAATAGKPPVKVVVAMGYIPNVQFAPYYVAEDRGYYAAEGLQVEFKYGQVNDLLKVVSEGAIDYANVSGDEMVPAVAQGIPVRYVLAQYYKYPIAAVAVAGRGVTLKSPADLKGRRIGIPGPYGSNYIGLKALLKAGNLLESDIKEQSIGFTQVQSLSSGQVDAAMTYSMNEPVQLQRMGKEVVTLQVSDYLDLAAVGLATSEKKINSAPDQVRAFVRATLRGTADTLKDPDGAFASTLKRTPELAQADQPVQRAVLTATLAFMTPPAARVPGSSDAKTWATTEQFLREIGMSPKPVDPTTLYTNAFIPEVKP